MTESRALRKNKTMALATLLPEPVRKPRKKLTPEELEARKKKVCQYFNPVSLFV